MPMTLTRSLLAVLIPGAIAITPAMIYLLSATTSVPIYKEYTALTNAMLFCIAAIVGSFCEGMGTHFEARWDKALQRKFQVTKNWYQYLARVFESEPVGYRYMSRLATTLYFELSMSVALVFFGVGSALLAHFHAEYLGWLLAIGALAACYLLSYYFYWQAKCTHEALCRTRRQLNRLLE